MAGERIEAEMTVSGLEAFLATTPALSVVYGANVTGGANFITPLLAEIETALNNNCQGYPQTAAATLAAIGYGDWTGGAGYLFNENSGNAAAVYGTPTLTAVSTPTYGFAGPRGGIDKAVGFNSASDAFTGGNVYDLAAPTDLLVAGSIYFDGLDGASDDIISKGFIGGVGAGWYICREASALSCYLTDGATTVRVTVAVPASTWLAFILVADRANQTMRIAVAPIATGVATASAASSIAAVGSPTNVNSINVGNNGTNGPLTGYLSALYINAAVNKAGTLVANLTTAVSNLANAINASWDLSLGSDGRVSIGWTGYPTPTWSLAFSTTLLDVLGFTANITNATTAQTGTRVARGVWVPGTNILADSDPMQAPIGDDASSSISPTGRTYSIASSEYYRARNVRFPMVNRTRVWANAATTPGADWETFYLDTQLAHHSWFDVRSRVMVFWDNAGVVTELGNGNVEAWTMPKCVKLDELSMSIGNWTGLFDINLGDLYTDE